MIYHVPAELFTAITNYLASRPYTEVGGVMPTLAALQPVDDAPATKGRTVK